MRLLVRRPQPPPPGPLLLAVAALLTSAALTGTGDACTSFSATQISSTNTWASLAADVDRNGLLDVFVCQENGQYGCVETAPTRSAVVTGFAVGSFFFCCMMGAWGSGGVGGGGGRV